MKNIIFILLMLPLTLLSQEVKLDELIKINETIDSLPCKYHSSNTLKCVDVRYNHLSERYELIDTQYHLLAFYHYNYIFFRWEVYVDDETLVRTYTWNKTIEAWEIREMNQSTASNFK